MAKIQLVKNLFNTFMQPQSCQATAKATTAASNVASTQLQANAKCCKLHSEHVRERQREKEIEGEAKSQIEEGERESEPAGWWRIAWHFCNQRYANVAA